MGKVTASMGCFRRLNLRKHWRDIGFGSIVGGSLFAYQGSYKLADPLTYIGTVGLLTWIFGTDGFSQVGVYTIFFQVDLF